MYCKNCNKEIPDNAVICVGCGTEVKQPAVTDRAGAGWWWLGFLVPIAGLLIWSPVMITSQNGQKKQVLAL